MQLVEGAEPLQRSDLVRTEVRGRHQAGAHGRAVDEHRAGAALPKAATEFRAIELETEPGDFPRRSLGRSVRGSKASKQALLSDLWMALAVPNDVCRWPYPEVFADRR